MNPKAQFVFFFLGALCFFMASFKENWPPNKNMSRSRYTAIGWLLFSIPFAYTAAVQGW